jgi:hypothetical protein
MNITFLSDRRTLFMKLIFNNLHKYSSYYGLICPVRMLAIQALWSPTKAGVSCSGLDRWVCC